MLGVWTNPARLLIVRKGNPLHFRETAGGYYFASLPEELPGKDMVITDQYAGVLAHAQGGLQHESHSVRW